MSEVLTYKPIQVLSYDPTKTLTLRTAFVADMNRRFKALIKVIKEAIVEQDCFGLEVLTQAELTPPYSQAFNFPSVQEKVSAFMEWLKIQEERGLLETSQNWRIGTSLQEAWTNLYIEDSYKRGVQRARYEMKKNGYEVPTTEASGGIDAIMGASFHVDHVGIAYIRAFTELQGITAAMDTVISEVLAQGLIDGDGARLIARKLEALISGKGLGELGITDKRGRFIPAQQRARTLARTEIIRAHHLANIQEYKNWKVLGVQVTAEFSTAGDDRVCSQCAGYHGNRYTLQEVEFMIPVHPNCRCIALPITKLIK